MGVSIKRPNELVESRLPVMALQRTMAGSVATDQLNTGNRVWELTYRDVLKSDFDTINDIYQEYLGRDFTMSFQVIQSNYVVPRVQVHIDLQVRSFSVGGSSYLSNFSLILTEG